MTSTIIVNIIPIENSFINPDVALSMAVATKLITHIIKIIKITDKSNPYFSSMI